MKRFLPYILSIFFLAGGIFVLSSNGQSLEVMQGQKKFNSQVAVNDGIQIVAKRPYIGKGEVGVLALRCTPKATCKVICNYKINGKDYNVTRTFVAGNDGSVLCTWKVDKNTDSGAYDIEITCGESRFLTNYIVK